MTTSADRFRPQAPKLPHGTPTTPPLMNCKKCSRNRGLVNGLCDDCTLEVHGSLLPQAPKPPTPEKDLFVIHNKTNHLFNAETASRLRDAIALRVTSVLFCEITESVGGLKVMLCDGDGHVDAWPMAELLNPPTVASPAKVLVSLAPYPANLYVKIAEILKGIDRRENDEEEGGWWETSEGAEFGARKLEEIRKLFTALPSDKPTTTELKKKAALHILQTRNITDALIQRFFGAVLATAAREAKGHAPQTASEILALFVKAHLADLKNCPLIPASSLLPIPGTRAHYPIMPSIMDAPAGHLWRCKDCLNTTPSGNEALAHVDRYEHAAPELLEIQPR